MRLTKITTKSGDNGKTLLGCNLVEKNHSRVKLLGQIDMLNCYLGLIDNVEVIQNILFNIGAAVYKDDEFPDLTDAVEILEDQTNIMNAELPNLEEFIIPRGIYHVARSYTRIVEIDFLEEYKNDERTKSIRIFLNRLSDYLFVLARSKSEKEWMWRTGIS